LPAWVSNWATVDKTLMNIADINKDGIVQLAEIVIGGDLIVLATPEIAGLPYVISGLVAAGGLAAALSTADGLLLTIANALSHDLYYKMIDPNASTVRRIAVSKGLLLVVALIGRLRHQPEAGRHPVPGRCGLLAGSLGLLPGAGAAACSGSAPTTSVRCSA
jgi:Na+(H+)/acetate symporter ActP